MAQRLKIWGFEPWQKVQYYGGLQNCETYFDKMNQTFISAYL